MIDSIMSMNVCPSARNSPNGLIEAVLLSFRSGAKVARLVVFTLSNALDVLYFHLRCRADRHGEKRFQPHVRLLPRFGD